MSGTPQQRGAIYEQSIRDRFGTGRPQGTYIQEIGRFVDDVFEWQIFEAEHVDVYMTSIYNPQSSEPWQQPALDRVINHAREITNIYEGGAIYFTNDRAFADDYTRRFKERGISKFRFVVVPSTE